MSRLTVLSVGYSLASVGPGAVGGAEQVLSALDRTLVSLGHRSLVVAPEGSRTAGQLIPIPAVPDVIDEATRRTAQHAVQRAIEATLQQRRVNVIHMHGFDFLPCLVPFGPPMLVTLHLPPEWYPPEAFTLHRPQTYLVPVSASQHARCPPVPSLLPPIENGVPVDSLGRARHARRSFALMLARVSPEKGQHIALEAAHAAGVSLLLGGAVFGYDAHRTYFESEVAPLLDRYRRWLGPIGYARKRRLLAASRCVLIPSLAPETSSLVAMEAAAAGTPVIAFPSGALADIVEHGRTGFLVETMAEMAEAIRRVGQIDPDECRRVARARFSLARTTAAYLDLYQRVSRRHDMQLAS